MSIFSSKYEQKFKGIFYEETRELPGVAMVNISTIFMGKGNTLNYIDILK